MDKISAILIKLKNSKFRNSFYLKQHEINYISEKGIEKIKSHAYDFVNKHLKDIATFKDGRQTPMRGIPFL